MSQHMPNKATLKPSVIAALEKQAKNMETYLLICLACELILVNFYL